jgi:hypothetical protein
LRSASYKYHLEFFKFSPYLLSMAIVGFSLLRFREDIWDGVIISYAFETKDLSGLESWFFSSGWNLQYLLVRFEFFISYFTGLSFHLINILISILVILIILKEVNWVASVVFGLPKYWANVACCILAVMPAWSVLASSVMLIHVTCIALGLVGSRFLASDSSFKNILGSLFVIMSFQLNSMLVFIPILQLIMGVKFVSFKKVDFLSLRKFFLSFGLAVVFYCFIQKFNQPKGIYQGYNSLVDPSEKGFWSLLTNNLLSYSSFILVPMIAIVGFKGSFSFKKSDLDIYIKLITLIIASVFPYMAVGKTADLRDYTDWSYRHSLLLSIPLAILTTTILFHLESRENGIDRQFIGKRIIPTCIVIALISSLSLASLATKLNRQDFELSLSEELKNSRVVPAPGIVIFSISGAPAPIFREYEVNYLLFKTYGRIDWWGAINPTNPSNFEFPSSYANLPKSEIIFAKRPVKCRSTVDVKAIGHEGRWAIVRNYLDMNDSRSVEILNISTNC